MTSDLFDAPHIPPAESENKNAVELHGCIVCARIHTLLVVYAPDGSLKYCTVTSPGGHCVPDEIYPLAACDTHTALEIDAAYTRWQSLREEDPWDEGEEDE